jgi:hypothetical protein
MLDPNAKPRARDDISLEVVIADMEKFLLTGAAYSYLQAHNIYVGKDRLHGSRIPEPENEEERQKLIKSQRQLINMRRFLIDHTEQTP